MELEGYSGTMCNKRALNHDVIKSLSLSCRCHIQIDDSRVVDINFLCRNFLSPRCRNCLRDPDHAHLGNTRSSQDEDFAWPRSSQDEDFAWPTRVQNLEFLALAVAEKLHGV